MSIRYNDKGKFFTNVITKDPVPAIIQTLITRVQGNLHVRVDERVKDELNRGEQFLAITDATIYDLKGQRIYETEFMLLNRDHVIWIIPDDENTTYRQQRSEESV
jgi:hypothetical protein